MATEKLLRVLPYMASSVLSFTVACSSDSMIAMEGTTGTEKTNCVDGAHRCGCALDDGCGGGLACDAGTCEHGPLPAPGPAPEELPPPYGGPCTTDADCSNVETCANFTCTHAWLHPWFISYASVEPLACDPSVATRSGELAVGYFERGDIYNSIRTPKKLPTTTGCPFVWEEPMFEIEAFIGEFTGAQFVLQMFVEPDEPNPPIRIARWCWDSLHTGECGPIPAEFLAAGRLDAPDLHLEFVRTIE